MGKIISRRGSALPSDRTTGPQFIGVGPGKTGTSWMHNHLRAHPLVIFPPARELRYFWEAVQFPDRKFFHRLTGNDYAYGQHYRDYFRHFIKRYARNPARLFTRAQRLAWDCRYLFGTHDDAWYLKCFERKEGHICGEISPQYFFLPDSQIEHVRKLVPDVRIIISLREPTDWLWSSFRMQTPESSQHDAQVFAAYLKAYRAACNFSQALRRWRKHFAEEQLLILFYDQLCSSPWAFYCKICRFLQIEPDAARLPGLVERVNEGKNRKIPEEFRSQIASAWRDDIEELSKLLPAMPARWKEVA